MSYQVDLGKSIGIQGLNAVYTAGSLGAPGIAQLPSVTLEAQLGQIVAAQDLSSSTAGGGAEFIFVRVPISTAMTAGLIYSWTGGYDISVLSATVSVSSGFPLGVAINAVTSNASSLQYTWLQIQGRATVLKTAVQVLPAVPVYGSATAGRVKVLASAFRAIIGARTANQATVTSTTSSVLVYLHRPSMTAGT